MAYIWDDQLQRYRDGNGNVIPQSQVRDLIEQVIDEGSVEMADLAQSYAEGAVDQPTFVALSQEIIRNYHTAAAALARGGFSNLSPNDWGWVGARIRDEYKYLDEFASDIAVKVATDTVSIDGVRQRASLYPQAAWASQSTMERRVAAERGYTLEKRVLIGSTGTKSSCKDCLDLSALGYQPIGSLPPISDTICGNNCRCHFSYAR